MSKVSSRTNEKVSGNDVIRKAASSESSTKGVICHHVSPRGERENKSRKKERRLLDPELL